MLVSFAAAIEGGLSFGSEVTREAATTGTAEASGRASFGLSSLFGRFLDSSVEISATGTQQGEERSVERSSRSHTEASVAILLYDRLRKDGGYIVDPETHEDASSTSTLEPGALVEITGTIEKNAVDAIIDYIDAADILSNLATDEQPAPSSNPTSRKRRNSRRTDEVHENESPLGKIRAILDKDRKRTPISNVLLRCTVPRGTTAVVTLRTENLRDLTLSELHKNSVRVLGKVTRIVGPNEKMSAFENYGMALLSPAALAPMLQTMTHVENVAVELSEVEVSGPALQVLPLMIFV